MKEGGENALRRSREEEEEEKCPRSFTYQNQTRFSQKPLEPF